MTEAASARPAAPLRGRLAIRDWGHLVDTQTYHRIRHVCGNMRFVIDVLEEWEPMVLAKSTFHGE
jgi:hypothetical protein